jgi:hypothetical protein
MLRAKNNMQAALDRVAEWAEANGFRIFQEKTKAIHICRIRSKPENHPDPTIRREIKSANITVKITSKPEHLINRHLKNKKAYDQYGLRPSLTTPLFVKAKETCSMLEVHLKDVDQMVQPKYTPSQTWRSILTQQCLALPKGSSILRIRAELEETLNANYPNYNQIYADRSKMEERQSSHPR